MNFAAGIRDRRIPIVRLRPLTRPDPYNPDGPPIPDWTKLPRQLVITGCLVNRVSTDSPLLAGREETNTVHQVLAPSGADILPGDRLRYDTGAGVHDYSLIGEPFDWGPRSSIEVNTELVTG